MKFLKSTWAWVVAFLSAIVAYVVPQHKLVWNWKDAYRWFSMKALALIAAIQGVILAMPATWQGELVPWLGVTWLSLLATLTVVAAVLGGVGRVVDQGTGS